MGNYTYLCKISRVYFVKLLVSGFLKRAEILKYWTTEILNLCRSLGDYNSYHIVNADCIDELPIVKSIN